MGKSRFIRMVILPSVVSTIVFTILHQIVVFLGLSLYYTVPLRMAFTGTIALILFWQIFARIESSRLSEERYKKISITDDLTQLYNVRHFHSQLQAEIDRAARYEQPLSVLFIDLDDFKVFNDIHGHVEGDRLLSRLSYVVKRCLRKTDFACRYGGEEFSVILPMTTKEAGAILAEKIRAEIKKEDLSLIQNKSVTVSIGIAQYKEQEGAKLFVHRADQLMYQAKRNGKNCVCS